MPRRNERTAAIAADTRYLEEPAQKALVDRLARLEGHVRSVRQMVVDRRCADEILLQVAAVKAALTKFSATLLEHELKACVDSCMQGSADERLERVTRVMATVMKQS
jgi:DNA-binding FrmR family transcriptional regulator